MELAKNKNKINKNEQHKKSVNPEVKSFGIKMFASGDVKFWRAFVIQRARALWAIIVLSSDTKASCGKL